MKVSVLVKLGALARLTTASLVSLALNVQFLLNTIMANLSQLARQSQYSGEPATLTLSDPPYQNFFYSDCNTAAQVVVTSPLPDSDLEIIGPRLIVAWPAGNSGVCAFFAPQNGVNGSLSISLVNSTAGAPLTAIHAEPPENPATDSPIVGVQGIVRFNTSAVLTVPILGSIRTIRDFVEGPSLLYPEVQDATRFNTTPDGGVTLERLWLDNVTTTSLNFVPMNSSYGRVSIAGKTVNFTPGDYMFSASYNYPQLTQLKPSTVLANKSADLITEYPTQTTALSFLSYSEKLLAGAWRFLTYFGRDSMISALLLDPVLSSGEDSAMEAVIGSVLERINRTDGSACHEETIGYALHSHMLYFNCLEADCLAITPPG